MTLPPAYLLARRGGRLGRNLAVGVDLLAGIGPAYLWRRRREERELARLWPGLAVNRSIWSEACAELGAELKDLGGGRLEMESGGAGTRVRLHVTSLDDEATLRLALDKAESHLLLAAAGVPVPECLAFDIAAPEEALSMVAGSGAAWVVKPAGGASSGQGATTGVRSHNDLMRAMIRAARSGRRQLLERQADGEEYRLLLLDGELLGAVRRNAPSVVGDGQSTIARLLHEENRRRLAAKGRRGLKLLTLDLDALLTLERAGLQPGSVPAAGQRVVVKESRSQAGAEDSETVSRSSLAAELIAEAARAAAAIGLRLAGIDLVTPDRGLPLAEADGVVIEVNGTPGFHYHYLVRDPERADRVAVPVLRRLLDEAGRRGP